MHNSQRYRAVRKVTIISATTNSLLAIFKVLIGYFGHSQALIADGLHSFSDLVTDALVLVASKAGGRLPDAEHPYGHRRIETVATAIIALIIIAVGVSIIIETSRHMLSGNVTLLPKIPVIIVAVISIFANEGLYQYSRIIGQRINSSLLISNAWHNRSDALTSIIVLVSVIGTLLGFHHLDAIGAIVIAIIIGHMGIKMLWQAANELIDRGVNEEMRDEIINHIQSMPGVASIHQLRSRMHGGNVFVDVHILVDPFISVSEGHHISEQVHKSLREHFKNISDVTVHIDPEDDEVAAPSVHLPNRTELKQQLEVAWKNLKGFNTIQRTTLHYLDGKLSIEIYLPMSTCSTDQQKELTNQYNTAISHIPFIAEVTIHFMPE